MRISKIEIENFKGFYDHCEIDLHKKCKNLLVYGENGSGKSSLFQALDLFLESDDRNLDFKSYRNIFRKVDDTPGTHTAASGHIRLTLRQDERSGEHMLTWSATVRETGVPLIMEANKAKGFLDYKSLLETYFLHRHTDTVNLFDLLINTLLVNITNDITGHTFGEDWAKLNRLVESLQSRNTKSTLEKLEQSILDPNQIYGETPQIKDALEKLKQSIYNFNQTRGETPQIQDILEELKQLILNFNQGLISKLQELETKAQKLLDRFNYQLELKLVFRGLYYDNDKSLAEPFLKGQVLRLKIQFHGRPFGQHHLSLNEAKLSAIALAIYFAALLTMPRPQLALLVLDDVLIGLDMSNRLPVLDILETYFAEHQIILTTYDRHWYEIVRLHTADSAWEYIEFYRGQLKDFEFPIIHKAQNYLDRAKVHLDTKDYKASAVYIRSAFESILKKYALKKRIKIPYTDKPEEISSATYWDAIKNELPSPLVQEVEIYRKFILNPLSHSQLINNYDAELKQAIGAIEKLTTELSSLMNKKKS